MVDGGLATGQAYPVQEANPRVKERNHIVLGDHTHWDEVQDELSLVAVGAAEVAPRDDEPRGELPRVVGEAQPIHPDYGEAAVYHPLATAYGLRSLASSSSPLDISPSDV